MSTKKAKVKRMDHNPSVAKSKVKRAEIAGNPGVAKSKVKRTDAPPKSKVKRGGALEVSETDDEPSSVSPPLAEEPTKRAKPTIHDHIRHYDDLLDHLRSEIDRKSRSKENGVRSLQKACKMIEVMKKELPKVTRSKEARIALSTRRNTKSGFTMKYYISEEFAEFLQIDAAVDTISRIDATRAICVYSRLKDDEEREDILVWSYLNPDGRRNLQNPENKRTIIPDKTLARLLRIATKDHLNYTSIQRLVNHHFIEVVADEEDE